jgi:hypothetical protein
MPSADRITQEAVRRGSSEVAAGLSRNISPEVAQIDQALTSDSTGILGGLSKATSWATGLVMGVPLLGKLAGWTAKRKFLASSEHAVATKVSEHLNGFQKFTSLSEASLGELPVKMVKAGFHDSARHVRDFGKSFTQYGQRIFGEKIHGQIMQASAGNAVFAGAGAVGETAAAALSIGNRIKTLKAMQADITGKVPSTAAVIFGSDTLHPIVARARSELSGGKALGALALQMGGTAANAWLMLRGGSVKYFIAKSIGVSMGTNMLAGVLTSSDTALVNYQAMAKSFAQKGGAQMDQYVGLIGGLEPRANEQVVQQVAEKAFKEQLKPRDVLRLVASTNLREAVPMNPGKPVQGKFTEKLASAPAANDAALGASAKPVQGKFTGKLAAGPAAVADAAAAKPVQGKFTERAAANESEYHQSLRA